MLQGNFSLLSYGLQGYLINFIKVSPVGRRLGLEDGPVSKTKERESPNGYVFKRGYWNLTLTDLSRSRNLSSGPRERTLSPKQEGCVCYTRMYVRPEKVRSGLYSTRLQSTTVSGLVCGPSPRKPVLHLSLLRLNSEVHRREPKILCTPRVPSPLERKAF